MDTSASAARQPSVLRELLDFSTWSSRSVVVLGLTLLLLLGQALPGGKLFDDPALYLPLHTALEFLAIAVSGMVFALAWSLRDRADNNHHVMLGCGLLATCLIDFVHTLSYAGMPALVTPSGPEKAINFWLAARLVSAATLLLVAVLPTRTWSMARCNAVLLGAVTAALGVVWVGLAYPDWIPRTFVPGSGLTAFKIGTEYALALLYGAAAWQLAVRASRSRNAQFKGLAAAAWVLGLAELFFTLYADVTDLFNLLGHVYKAIAYLLVYQAIFAAGVREPSRQLSQERTHLKSLLATIPDLVWLKDTHGVYLSCNAAFERLYGASESQIVGKTDYAFAPRELADFFRANDRQAMQENRAMGNEEWLTFAEGGYRGLFETTKSPMRAADGTLIGVLGIAHDITKRKAAAEALIENEANYRTAIETSIDGFLVLDAGGQILETNDGYLKLSGYSKEALLTMHIGQLDANEDRQENEQHLQKIIQQGYDRFETTHRTQDGQVWPVEVAVSFSPLSGGRFFVFNRDISERQQAEARIAFLAFHDNLTNLPNRVLAQDRANQAMAYALRSHTKVALLFLDLDSFKTINDSLGHAVGDKLICEVAGRISHCSRSMDTVSRQGGDEFLMVLGNLNDAEDAAAFAAKVLDSVAAPMLLDGSELAITTSIGIAMFPDDASDFDALLKRADLAMYKAKHAGRNVYRFFDEAMNAEAIEQLHMRNGLRRAIANREFVLYYQPQIDLKSGRLVGAEALIRWNHPELGLVAPARFIPVAEDSGLILPIGEWVLQEACRQAVAWQQQGLPNLLMAVNLSAAQLLQGDIQHTVVAAMQDSGLAPALLELELTESMLIGDTKRALDVVRSLKQLGVRLSIDDFGTGYSSLSYLKKLQVDKLKIDQSFVRNLTTDAEDLAIVSAVIQLAQNLGLTTIAEGVEDGDVLQRLRELHCDEAQGYHFSRPVPAAEFLAFARSLG